MNIPAIKPFRKPLWLAIPLVISAALYFPAQLQASTTQQSRLQAQQLNDLIPLIEPDRVIAFRGGSWCEALADRQGLFANNPNPSCITPLAPVSDASIAPDRVAKFTPEAQAVHQSILSFAKQQGFDDLSFEQASYDDNGQLRRAQFRVVVGSRPQFYVYEPGYKIVKPTWKPGYRQPLTADWYKVRSRWD
jgi:hypothetical protein